MSRYKRIPQETKDAILQRIKEEGVTANRAAMEAQVSPKTVYGWLAKQTTKSGISWHEHNRLKRENQQLKEIVGHLTLDIRKAKKN